MIKVIDFRLDEYLPDENRHHDDLNSLLNEGYQIIGHCSYVVETRIGEINEIVVETEACERFTLYKSDKLSPQTALDDLVLTTLVSAERGETSNNQRPMWRCRTDDGEKVNIFLNTDEPEKDNYSLFKQAGWAEDLDAIRLYDTEEISIPVAMKKNGIWWEIVKVRTKPESNMPAWAMEGA